MNDDFAWKEFGATPHLMKWLFLCVIFHYKTEIKDLKIYFSFYFSRNIGKGSFIVIRMYLNYRAL